jgi:hypothetical protein
MKLLPFNIVVENRVNVEESKRHTIIEVRTLLPHQAKEVEQWSWHKFKKEKWIVFLDCKTSEIEMRQLEKKKKRPK